MLTDWVLKNHLLCWHRHRINNSALGRVVILWVLKERAWWLWLQEHCLLDVQIC